MKKKLLRPISPLGIKTYSLRSQQSKVDVAGFGRPCAAGRPVSELIRGLPDILAARDFKEWLTLMKKARAKDKPLVWAMGAHVIKVGLNPVLIDLMERGWITGLAMNGAGVIHDFEVAFSGRTSEDVEAQIGSGRFGMARETGRLLNQAINRGAEQGLGLGETVAKMINDSGFPHKNLSLLAGCARLGIPVTVHVAVGTDTIHFHPEARGEALGKTSLHDFFLFCAMVAGLNGGGVFLNVGSAVILPEVLLKSVTLIRNKGKKLENFYAAVFDFIRHYRPSQNIVQRVVGKKGKGFYFIGHHEIMIPLLAAGLKD